MEPCHGVRDTLPGAWTLALPQLARVLRKRMKFPVSTPPRAKRGLKGQVPRVTETALDFGGALLLVGRGSESCSGPHTAQPHHRDPPSPDWQPWELQKPSLPT